MLLLLFLGCFFFRSYFSRPELLVLAYFRMPHFLHSNTRTATNKFKVLLFILVGVFFHFIHLLLLLLLSSPCVLPLFKDLRRFSYRLFIYILFHRVSLHPSPYIFLYLVVMFLPSSIFLWASIQINAFIRFNIRKAEKYSGGNIMILFQVKWKGESHAFVELTEWIIHTLKKRKRSQLSCWMGAWFVIQSRNVKHLMTRFACLLNSNWCFC